MKSVFITRLSKYLPNDPIDNEDMEEYLGLINNKPSKAKRIILRSNGIKTRYYALNKNGESTHNNAELAANAVEGLIFNGFGKDDIEILACGTSSVDQLLPSHTSMVHGYLRGKPVEIISPSGACCTGMHALKYCFMAIGSGLNNNAICVGSEKTSSWMKADKFNKEAERIEALENEPYIAFEKDFLRFMLSDGAGAALLQDKPNPNGLSLKIEWIESVSFANEIQACMYAGAEKTENGNLISWNDHQTDDYLNKSLFAMKQDVKLLKENIVPAGMKFMVDKLKKHNVSEDGIDYFLPHMSSEFFRSKIDEEVKKNDYFIHPDKWFTNLHKVGNVGAASIYLMMEELFNSGKLKDGEHIFLAVPESARFSYSFAYLTVVSK